MAVAMSCIFCDGLRPASPSRVVIFCIDGLDSTGVTGAGGLAGFSAPDEHPNTVTNTSGTMGLNDIIVSKMTTHDNKTKIMEMICELTALS